MNVIEAIGHTPLVELKRVASGLPNRVFVKCEHLNPGGSVKDRTARAIILDAEARGVLVPHRNPPMTIVEGTAGNTGVGLALLASARGYRCVVVIPERVAADKRVALRQLGAEVYIAKAAGIKSPDNFRNVAERLAKDNGWFLANQFHNPANLDAHYGGKSFSATGPELLEQAAGKIGAFVCAAGTGGTITGVGKYLKQHLPRVEIVLADPIGSGLGEWVNTGELGPDGPFAVEGIGSASVPSNLHRDAIDYDGRAAGEGGGLDGRRVDGGQRGRRAARRRAPRHGWPGDHGRRRPVGPLPIHGVDEGLGATRGRRAGVLAAASAGRGVNGS
jgi:cysteine synthase